MQLARSPRARRQARPASPVPLEAPESKAQESCRLRFMSLPLLSRRFSLTIVYQMLRAFHKFPAKKSRSLYRIHERAPYIQCMKSALHPHYPQGFPQVWGRKQPLPAGFSPRYAGLPPVNCHIFSTDHSLFFAIENRENGLFYDVFGAKRGRNFVYIRRFHTGFPRRPGDGRERERKVIANQAVYFTMYCIFKYPLYTISRLV